MNDLILKPGDVYTEWSTRYNDSFMFLVIGKASDEEYDVFVKRYESTTCEFERHSLNTINIWIRPDRYINKRAWHHLDD
jgi:hypothetical protein